MRKGSMLVASAWLVLALVAPLQTAKAEPTPVGDAGRKQAANPILTPGPAAWEAGNVLDCSIIRDDKGYKLYYTGEAAPGYAFRSIGVALSADGIHWKKYAGNPLISPSRDIK